VIVVGVDREPAGDAGTAAGLEHHPVAVFLQGLEAERVAGRRAVGERDRSASTVERAGGRPALVETLCDPVRLLRRYNTAAGGRRQGDPALPVWSETLLARLSEGR
jgi:hypothetical protein